MGGARLAYHTLGCVRLLPTDELRAGPDLTEPVGRDIIQL